MYVPDQVSWQTIFSLHHPGGSMIAQSFLHIRRAYNKKNQCRKNHKRLYSLSRYDVMQQPDWCTRRQSAILASPAIYLPYHSEQLWCVTHWLCQFMSSVTIWCITICPVQFRPINFSKKYTLWAAWIQPHSYIHCGFFWERFLHHVLMKFWAVHCRNKLMHAMPENLPYLGWEMPQFILICD